MLKNKLLIFSFLISVFCWSQTTTIPDPNFELYLETHDNTLNNVTLGDINSMGDGILNNRVPTNKINTVSELDIPNLNISNLTGIEDFTSLTKLDCSQNQLTNIDVVNLSNLQILWCFNNTLSNLDISQNTNLISLRCENNQLLNLDISNNSNLNVFVCEQNLITNLNLSNNLQLSRLLCGNNNLSNLDVSVNTNLIYLSCEQNNIQSLDITNHNNLAVLLCNNNELTELDLSQNFTLTQLNCSNNQLCYLNIKNGNNNNISVMNFNNNPILNCVIVDNSNANHSLWQPLSFSNYVNTSNECNTSVPVDSLDNIIGTSYTLPFLFNGNYYTESNGNGSILNSGDIISSSQRIYIYNTIGCNNNESSFNVIITSEDYIIPKYFTPNNDGNHDRWKVYDSKNLINNILIFNRYGKLLKSLQNNSNGWDGTFNGKLLKNDDYWYQILLHTGEVLKGHFTLKR